MNPLAIHHLGRGVDCFALDTNTFRIRLRCAHRDFDRVELCYSPSKYSWHIHRQTDEMQLWGSDGELDYYTIDLHLDCTLLSYIFILHSQNSLWYYSEEGFSKNYDFDRGFYTFFQYPFIHDCDVHYPVSWADRTVMYQIFPERFAIGIPHKKYITAQWDQPPKPTDYFGGDLPGITQHLDYLTDLGVNCIYLTPVNVSKSNHKYIIDDYACVDPDFGGNEALLKLVDTAHSRGIRVLLDGVYNHCSLNFPPFLDVLEKGRASAYWNWFLIDGKEVNLKTPNYQHFGACPDMPKLNTSNPEVMKYFADIAVKWMQQFSIDGWRLDVMDEISLEFLRGFRRAVKKENPDALILGETWHNPELWLRGDQLDGVMNYGLSKSLIDYLLEKNLNARQMAARLMRLYLRTSTIAAEMNMNLISSHDTHRFLTLLKGDKARLKLAFGILFFYIGIPCIYYGDEVGMEGGYDPGCRGGFPWESEKWDRSLRALVQKLCRLRQEGAMDGGKIQFESVDDCLIITRKGARLLINATDHPIDVVIHGVLRHLDSCGYQIETLPQ
ncbi:MAG: glycoside hydrolase family 13 protein [Christensenellales bacterium]|nr:glycoside hydrolase family 13 protein [Christensenellales bacterium]